VMTAFDRENQLGKTLESIHRQGKRPQIIVKRDERPRGEGEFLNPAALINKGLLEATGDIVILQNAECLHLGNVIEQFERKIERGKAIFASVQALDPKGMFDQWYCHPEERPVPYFFCGAMLRQYFLDTMFDERFTGAGYDDVDFANRLEESGIEFVWDAEILVQHQWHKPFQGNSSMNEVYRLKREAEGKEVRLYP
jgi:hypothetical protein